MYVDPDPECHEEGWGTARSTAVAVAVAVAVGGTYALTYGVERYLTYAEMLGPRGELVQFAVVAGLFVAHEAVHALAYVVCGVSPADVEVEFGLDREAPLDPVHHSVHPGRPIERWRYYVGVAAPGVALGVAPATLALATGNPLAMFVGGVGLLLVATDVSALVAAIRHPESIAAPESTS